MDDSPRLVLDTNVVVSAIAFPASVPKRALLRAQAAITLVSQATLFELIHAFERAKWDRYIDRQLRSRLLAEFMTGCETVSVITSIRACRDPKDDKFLELAIDGRADLILSGDQDLLVLHPFRGIAILTPAQYLALDDA
jgi:putative PIN family toxin of toxin-antitoxin system